MSLKEKCYLCDKNIETENERTCISEAAHKICVDLFMKKNSLKNNIYLLTNGTGEDGDEWSVVSVHATEESAKQAKVKYEQPRPCSGRDETYTLDANIEVWEVQS